MSYALRLNDEEITRYRLMATNAKEHESDLWQLAGIVPGARVVDVGCGPGVFLALLAQTVGPDGHVIGIDAQPDAVAAARDTLGRQQLANGEVRIGQADATGLAVDSFDAAMLRHVLAHNGGREQRIVDHLAALVRPGGSVYLLDIDASASMPAPDHADLQDLMTRYAHWHAARGNDLTVGRRLADLGHAAGLQTLHHESVTSQFTPPPGMRGPGWAARDALIESGLANTDDLIRWDTAFRDVASWARPPQLTAVTWIAICRKP
jgi:ubiquinone/menaquinone biosynthesis C-methylase UbiE